MQIDEPSLGMSHEFMKGPNNSFSTTTSNSPIIDVVSCACWVGIIYDQPAKLQSDIRVKGTGSISTTRWTPQDWGRDCELCEWFRF